MKLRVENKFPPKYLQMNETPHYRERHHAQINFEKVGHTGGEGVPGAAGEEGEGDPPPVGPRPHPVQRLVDAPVACAQAESIIRV